MIKTTRSSFLTSASISIPIKASFARANIRTTCVLTVGVYITRFDLALTFVDILKSGKNALYQAKASMNIFIVGHYHPVKQFCFSKLINGTHSCVPWVLTIAISPAKPSFTRATKRANSVLTASCIGSTNGFGRATLVDICQRNQEKEIIATNIIAKQP